MVKYITFVHCFSLIASLSCGVWREMKVRLQYRFLFKLLAFIAVLALLLGGVHRWQVYRNASQVLTQARKAAEAGDQVDAVRFYTQYLGLRRDSADAQLELAEILARNGNFNKAFFYLEGALRIDPSLTEGRKSLVKVAMELERYADAKSNLSTELIPQDSKNAEYYFLLGLCENKLGEFDAAVEHLTLAVELDKQKPIYAGSLAELLRDRMNRASDGRVVLDTLVSQVPEDPEAFLTRGRWLLAQSREMATADNSVREKLLENAWQDAQTANRLAPDRSRYVLFLVDLAIAKELPNDVRDAVQSALKANPWVPELYADAARIEMFAKQPEAAMQFLQDGLKAIPGSPELLYDLAQLELDSGDIEAGEKLISELRSLKVEEAPIRFLEARVLAGQGKWRQAATLLVDSRASFDRSKELLKGADFLLSLCYQNLGNPDQEIEALRRAIGADPLWASAREALANAFLRSGRIQESMAELSQIVQQPRPMVSAVLSLARLQFLDGLGRNASGDDWNPLRRVLDQLESIPDAANEHAIMRAELFVAENKMVEAEVLLRSRLAIAPTFTALHQALISLQIRNKAWDEVERSLESAQKSLTDSVTVRLERARYLIRRYGKQVDVNELEKLSIPEPDWDAKQKLQLASGFASSFLSIEDYERGKRFARVVADADIGQSNLSIHLLLFELAFRSSDVADMTRSLEQVKKIEGMGPLWRVGEAIRLSVEAKKISDSAKDNRVADNQIAESDALYAKAMAQLAEAAVERPNWARIPRLKGEIYDRQRRPDLAVQSYLEAIRVGEQSPQVIARAIVLLFEKGRFTEADEVVRKLQEQKTPFSSELTRVASQVSLELENFDRALSLANDWAIQSDKQEDHVWLAQVHLVSRNFVKAEEEFRIAIKKDPTAPGPWVSLVQMFGRQGNTDAATKVIEVASREIRPEHRDLALAQAYQAIEDLENASMHYKKAMENRSDDFVVMRKYADFCLSTAQESIAEPILMALVSDESEATEDDQSWARRSLALIFGVRGSDDMLKKARELLEINTKKNGPNILDQRTLALILSNRSDASAQAESIRLLEQIAKQERKFSLTDNFLLANLYLRSNDWARYSRLMRSVLGNGGAADSRYVRNYADSLMKKGELIEGELWLSRLKKMAPKELSTATIEAQLLFRSKDYTRLIKLLETSRNAPEQLLWAAQTAESVGTELTLSAKKEEALKFLDIARDCYTEISKRNSERPLALAAYCARRGELKQCLAFLGGPNLSPDEVGDLIQGALQSGTLKAEDARELIGVLQNVQAKNPKNVPVNMGLGDLWSWLGEGAEAASAYQLALLVDPNNIQVLNNLAMVLALTKVQLPNATLAIDRAVSVVGPTDYLLDTRGSVRFAIGNIPGAEQDFRKAIEVSPRADRFFHLAQVLAAQNRLEEARAEMKKAHEAGATAELLHPLERKAFESLAKQ